MWVISYFECTHGLFYKVVLCRMWWMDANYEYFEIILILYNGSELNRNKLIPFLTSSTALAEILSLSFLLFDLVFSFATISKNDIAFATAVSLLWRISNTSLHDWLCSPPLFEFHSIVIMINSIFIFKNWMISCHFKTIYVSRNYLPLIHKWSCNVAL